MSNVDRKSNKRPRRATAKKLGWVVPAKRQPVFPSSTSASKPLKPTAKTKQAIASRKPNAHRQPGINRKSARTQKSLARPKKYYYFASSKRPIASLYLVLPLILCYEFAKIFAGGEQLSSGVDLWIHSILSGLGAGQIAFLPLLTTISLLLHHHKNQDPWNVQPATIPKMLGEAMGFGLMLFFFANIFQIAAAASPNAGKLVDPYFWQIGSTQWWSNVVTYVGTGIHEELIFRVILMLPLIKLLKDVFEDGQAATIIAVIAVGLLFALAHVDVINPLGEPFNSISFTFRFIASCVFSTIFLYRGFGIVVATHIIYNVLTLIA